MATTTAREMISHMDIPTEWMEGTVFDCRINFYDPTSPEREDETSFDIDCSQPNWREDLLSLWEDFCKENALPTDCISDVWATTIDDAYWRHGNDTGR